MNNNFKQRAASYAATTKRIDIADLIILVETHFRPRSIRILEYIWLACLMLVQSKRYRRLTVGLNQMRVDYWESYLRDENLSCDYLNIVITCENLLHARAAINYYLRKKQRLSEDIVPLSQIYTGRRNKYYDQLLSYAFRLGNR